MRRLVLDVGNTRTNIGLFEAGELTVSFRVTTAHWTTDDLLVVLRGLLMDDLLRTESLAFACVVPQVRHSLLKLPERYLGAGAVEVTPDTAGIAIGYRYPHELGADRLANAVAAAGLGPLPAIVADFGTATTFDVVGSDGSYVGGAITPGVGTAAAELFKKAERLNPVDLEFPDRAIGRSTPEAVCSGVLQGAVGAADRIVGLISREMDAEPALWATGGWAPGIASRCESRFRVVPEMTLVGIDMIGERNEGRPDG